MAHPCYIPTNDPNDAHLPLTRLSIELTRLTGRASPRYGRIYTAVLDGLIPAEKYGRGYVVKRADLPAIAATLGLTAA